MRACSAKLSPEAQLIVKTLIPKLKPGVDVRKVMRSTVIGLVRSGKIPRSTARTEAQADSQCLKQMKG